MQSKRKRILTMLENGTITTDEALTLLENLSDAKEEGSTVEKQQGQSQLEKQQAQPKEEQLAEEISPIERQPMFEEGETNSGNARKEEPPVDEFLEDLRKDFTNVGERFMQFMQTAVHKVKKFDFDSPFGQSTTFSHTMTKKVDEIEEIILDVDHGKVTVHSGEGTEVKAEFSVKAFNHDSEEKAKEDFLEKVLFVADGEKLRLASDMKMTQVNIDLYIPGKSYKKLSARLLNGAFKMKNAEVETVRVKTANGKIDVSQLTCKQAEFETANGAIRLNDVTGESVQAETLNGRVYIDGYLKEVEAQSLNGHVVVTTKESKAEKIEAKTVSGSVEIYIPSTVSLSGEIASNIGRLDLQLPDVDQTAEQEQLLQRTIRFKKNEAESDSTLHVFGEAKTGTVLVCYNAKHE